MNKKNKEPYSVEELKKLAKKYSFDFTDDNEKLVINLALKGQDFLNNNDYKKSEEICDVLFNLSNQWKDDFTKMKAHLLRAQISNYKNEDSLLNLKTSLKLAQKMKITEIEIGIRVQMAFEKFRARKFKETLKEIKEISKHSDINEENSRVIGELKARSYWELDDFVRGFDATLNWFEQIKEDPQDLTSFFMIIVYLLTVMSSISLSHKESRLKEIRNDISSVLNQLATATHLFGEIIPNLDTLFAKSLMLTEPEILHGFADLILQTTRWMDEEKYLFLCQKIADAFYDINDFEKSNETMNKAIQYVKEKKYDKILPLLQFKKTEITSLIFYYMPFDALFDPFLIKSIEIYENSSPTKWFLNVLYSSINSYPATSYSHFMRILEKAAKTSVEEKKLQIEGLTEEEEKCFFVLKLKIAEETIHVLMKEDFKIEKNVSQSLHSTLSPYYSVIGILTKDQVRKISKVEDVEAVLLEIQRAVNCPAAEATIYFPKQPPELNLFKYFNQDKNFKILKSKLLSSALTLKKQYPFVRKDGFLQLFQSDPITIFDLSLRNVEDIYPLTNLLKHAYGITVSNADLSEFFKNMIEIFLRIGDNRFWWDYFYQFAWLQLKGEFLSLQNDEIIQKKELNQKLQEIALKLDNKEKILESIYFKIIASIISKNKETNKLIEELKLNSEKFENNKYSLLTDIIEKIYPEDKIEKKDYILSTINEFCELCEYKDWEKSLELFILMLKKIPNMTTLFEICKNREIKDSGFIIYLHVSRHLISLEEYGSASQMLDWIISTLEERKNVFHYPEHTWNYFYVTANQLLYESFDQIPSEIKATIKIPKSELLENLIQHYEWIADPIMLVELLREKAEIYLNKTDFVQAEKIYHWIEQEMIFFWDIFTKDENKSLVDKIQETKKRIVSQHFI
jgi:hypothetical protein